MAAILVNRIRERRSTCTTRFVAIRNFAPTGPARSASPHGGSWRISYRSAEATPLISLSRCGLCCSWSVSNADRLLLPASFAHVQACVVEMLSGRHVFVKGRRRAVRRFVNCELIEFDFARAGATGGAANQRRRTAASPSMPTSPPRTGHSRVCCNVDRDRPTCDMKDPGPEGLSIDAAYIIYPRDSKAANVLA